MTVRKYSVPTNALLRLRTIDSLSSKHANVGDKFKSTVVDPVYSSGFLVMFQRRVFKSATSVFLAFTVPLFSACDGNRQYVLKRLPAGDDRSIIISADLMAEISKSVYYEVKIGEEIVTPRRLICFSATDPDSLSFKTLSAVGGNLIGVYEESEPETILVLHDFSKGTTWPRGSPDKSDWENDTAGGKLLEELQKEFPDRNLKLNKESCGLKLSGNR